MNTATCDTTKRWLAHLCALCVAGFFLYAAFNKIGYGNTRQFAVEINNYRILPERYLHIPAIILPWWETVAALALILPATRKAGAILIGAMLLFFIGAVSYSALYLGLKISCGCTGAGSSQAGWTTIGRNTLLLVATLASVYLPRKRCTAPLPCADEPAS
ncbi:MAG: MauE/DoxX family redox-associated membrane protein [Phycisphaerae bacterium]